MKRRRRDYAPEGPIELLKAVLADSPRLSGARCRRHPLLFDPQHHDESIASVADRHARAAAVCDRCPALAACGAWLDDLDARQRPAGVIAGRAPRLGGRPTT